MASYLSNVTALEKFFISKESSGKYTLFQDCLSSLVKIKSEVSNPFDGKDRNIICGFERSLVRHPDEEYKYIKTFIMRITENVYTDVKPVDIIRDETMGAIYNFPEESCFTVCVPLLKRGEYVKFPMDFLSYILVNRN